MNHDKNNYSFSICLIPYVGILDICTSTRKIKDRRYSKKQHCHVLEIGTRRFKIREPSLQEGSSFSGEAPSKDDDLQEQISLVINVSVMVCLE